MPVQQTSLAVRVEDIWKSSDALKLSTSHNVSIMGRFEGLEDSEFWILLPEIEAWRIDGTTRSGETIIRKQGRYFPLDSNHKEWRQANAQSAGTDCVLRVDYQNERSLVSI